MIHYVSCVLYDLVGFVCSLFHPKVLLILCVIFFYFWFFCDVMLCHHVVIWNVQICASGSWSLWSVITVGNCLYSHPENYSRQWLDGKNVLEMWGNHLLMCWLGARFGFKLEEELKSAASCEEVKEALGTKVSRERIGHEVINFLPVYEP